MSTSKPAPSSVEGSGGLPVFFVLYPRLMGSFTMSRIKSFDLLYVLKQKQGASSHHKENYLSI